MKYSPQLIAFCLLIGAIVAPTIIVLSCMAIKENNEIKTPSTPIPNKYKIGHYNPHYMCHYESNDVAFHKSSITFVDSKTSNTVCLYGNISIEEME